MAAVCPLSRRFAGVVLALLGITAALPAAQPRHLFTLKKDDHICIIGNTLAERMQHDGWLETYLHSRFPEHNLVIRNLGFSGDELTVRLRSQSFGTPDQWLAGAAPVPEPGRLFSRIGVRENRFETTNTRADVVFAFFGYNESFAGEAGLPKFKKDLEEFIKHTLGQKYNGKSAPRLVLFSPIAHENLKDKNHPDGTENNKRLALYTMAMADVAQAYKVTFVNLFQPTLQAYPQLQAPYTLNGVHLNGDGNHFVAEWIDLDLFGDRPKSNAKAMEQLRQAVRDKNFYWFNRYRILDGYNVYGGRAFEKYADKQSNYEDQQRELEIMDIQTANREKRVWAVARGLDIPVDDSNLPPLIPVKTNKPGPGPDGKHVFADATEAIKQMTVAKNMKVTLFASERDFPLLAKPVQMQFDSLGRLWVAVWPSYPHWNPTEEMNDKILIFEDTKGTGKADKMTIFADHLHCPTGFEFYNGGVLVAQAPDLIFMKDTDGDGKADVRQRVLHGLDSADSHHTANSFALDPGGALYFQEGTFHHSQVESAYGPPSRCANGGVFRYEPRTHKFDVYVSTPFANPHGHVWDRWGQDIVYDGTGANPYHGALFSGHVEFPDKHPRPPQVYQQRTRPCPGVEILSSRHFPAENQGNLLVGNVIGFQGILQYKVQDKGASLGASEVEPILSSTDPNFRPSDIKMGPDGAIWFIDWYNPIIGHLQHALRDPSRDRAHGRIYRVIYEGRPLLQSKAIAGEQIDRLLDLLKEPEDRVRYRARIELGGRSSEQVVAAARKWIAGLDMTDANYEHLVLEGLWIHQYHNVVNVDLLKRVLASHDFRARAAAARVLCYWRDRVPDALDIFKTLAADKHPRVRLEAVRAASFFPVPEAVEIPVISTESASDEYLDFVRNETMKTLSPLVKRAVAEGRSIPFTSEAGARYFLRSVATDDLLKMTRTRPVLQELLLRKGVRDEYRKEAVSGLANLDKKNEVQILLDTLRGQDEPKSDRDDSVTFDLVRLLTSRRAAEMAAVRSDLEAMAVAGKLPLTRQLGFVALIAADGKIGRAWDIASKSVPALQDLVSAMPFIRDPGVRAELYPKVEPLLSGLPKSLAATARQDKGTKGRYVRVELPGRRKTLTLAEVEVWSDGRNVARQGKARQSSTSHGGDASRAIDGNTNGSYDNGGQTHSEENAGNPWWEVDLGREYPIDSVIIWNRTDGTLGNRLTGYTLKVLDDRRQVVIEKPKQPAPEVKAAINFERGGSAAGIRHAVMQALPSVRGQEAATFKSLARFVREEADRLAAIHALQRIPTSLWPAEEARPLLDDLLGYLRKLPTRERTSVVALDAQQLAEALTSFLPKEEARVVRKELGELGVRVLRLGTIPDQMLFDKERLVVRAGKPFEILFENTDLMPHNFVITEPGALEEVGNLGEAAATQPGAAERQYVPASKKILLASRLLQPRDAQKLSFTAPTRPGVYPYVCTYPGHWRRMFGALYVVDDLDSYLAEPENYLAKNPLPVADELLKFNRPRKEWKLEELASSVEALAGRSFSHGKQMFQVANCVACHKMHGTGIEVGPDLTKLDPKWKAGDILKEILDPSAQINEKYYTYIIETNAGKVITGLILEETAELVKVIENPLARSQPVLLKKSEIAERKKSPSSIMPKGLLDKLSREEVLDLIAYLNARGNEQDKAFQGEHGHGGH